MTQYTDLATGEVSDTELIKKILDGEKRLFEVIMRRYNQRLFRIGMSILGDDMEVEDAMQTSYIKAYEHLAQFENRSSLFTWLTRIMLNQCYEQQRKKQQAMSVIQQTENRINMSAPDNVLVNKELSDILEKAIARLPEKYRLVFMLREIEELSVKETSEALNIEEPNVKVRLNRAKNMLREDLNSYVKDSIYSFHLTRCDRIVNHVLHHLHIV